MRATPSGTRGKQTVLALPVRNGPRPPCSVAVAPQYTQCATPLPAANHSRPPLHTHILYPFLSQHWRQRDRSVPAQPEGREHHTHVLQLWEGGGTKV